MKKKYKVENLDINKPIIRFYQNLITGKKKIDSSFSILFKRNSMDISYIIEESELAFNSSINPAVNL